MLLASALPSSFAGTVFDLGAGSGAAALAVLSRCAKATAVLVENASEMVDCAERTLALPGNALLSGRTRLVAADVTLAGKDREAAGLGSGAADAVIFNPPFNDLRDRASSDALRREAHVMTEDLFDRWIRTAAAIAAPNAWCAVIFRPRHLQDVLQAMQGRFGGLGAAVRPSPPFRAGDPGGDARPPWQPGRSRHRAGPGTSSVRGRRIHRRGRDADQRRGRSLSGLSATDALRRDHGLPTCSRQPDPQEPLLANFLTSLLPARFRSDRTIIPVIRLQGAISAAAGSPLRQGLSFGSTAPLLQKAFSMKGAPAVAISINSPGGSPVQSRQIFLRIRALAEEKKKTVFVFCDDVAASGGYMIAIAGDEIYADPSSIVGSIGVLYAGFGFTEAIDRLGIERRVYTAGENKVTLDPFQPAKEEDVERVKSLQLEIHEVFKDMVRERRGDKLSSDPELFSGAFWTGQGALARGLVDGLGDVRSVMREKYGEGVRLRPIAPSGGFLGRRLAPFRNDMAGLGAGIAEGLIEAAGDRLLWQRFGL